MWWSRLVVALLAAALLHGCGFRPLYGKDSADVTRSLAQVRVELIPDRNGQRLRNLLLDRINPAGEPARPAYALSVRISLSRTDLGIERDETATRAVMVLNAEYSLRDTANGKTLIEGTAQSTNSFNIVASDFATLSGETDAVERASREISDDIKTRLALYFRRTRG